MSSDSERSSGTSLRKHLYLVTSHPNEDYIGQVEVREKRYEMAEKNEERVIDKRNLDTGEGYSERVVSLGYHDFEDEQDYEENFVDVVQKKLAEIDESHLENAGLDPQEVLP